MKILIIIPLIFCSVLCFGQSKIVIDSLEINNSVIEELLTQFSDSCNAYYGTDNTIGVVNYILLDSILGKKGLVVISEPFLSSIINSNKAPLGFFILNGQMFFLKGEIYGDFIKNANTKKFVRTENSFLATTNCFQILYIIEKDNSIFFHSVDGIPIGKSLWSDYLVPKWNSGE